MPRITYKKIIRQVGQFLIAPSLLELILDTGTSDDFPAPAVKSSSLRMKRMKFGSVGDD